MIKYLYGLYLLFAQPVCLILINVVSRADSESGQCGCEQSSAACRPHRQTPGAAVWQLTYIHIVRPYCERMEHLIKHIFKKRRVYERTASPCICRKIYGKLFHELDFLKFVFTKIYTFPSKGIWPTKTTMWFKVS